MEFKNVEINDREKINMYLMNNKYGMCNYSFANLFIWQSMYQTKYCIFEDFLIIRFYLKAGDPVFLMPLGNGDLKRVLEYMMNYSKINNECFRLSSLTDEMLVEIKELMPENFILKKEDELSEYLYLAEDLINLPGKKYSAKRNHINKFLSQYADVFEYVEIDENIIAECIEMTEKWCRERNCDKSHTDFWATEIALLNFRDLGLKGGAIRVNGEVVAFTLGQPNNSEVFDIVIEKALTHVDGSFPMINKEFASRECRAYTYINREEDMGIEGLRKAKRSYHPYRLMEKSLGELI